MPDSKYSSASDVEEIAEGLIPNHHPELASARIQYLFTETASKKGGRELMGKASKVSGRWEFLTELDFVIEVAAPIWKDLSPERRQALVDHLLEHCTAQENEETGDFKWSLREPDVKEFATVLQRHGCWADHLAGFLHVAQNVDLSSIVDEEAEDLLAEEDTSLDLTVDETDD